MTTPRYSFSDVQGVMRDGTSVVIADGPACDQVKVEFDYRDARDNQWYHVSAVGWQTKKENVK